MVMVVVPTVRPAVRDPLVPVPGRRRRRPADVAVAGRADAPGDPRAGVTTAGNPRPAMTRQVDPAAVVEWRPAPRVVGDPDVVGRFAVRPVTRRHVRLEVVTHFCARRDPDGAVRRVLDPRAVVLEHGLELGERARIRIRVLVAVGADEDLARLDDRLLARLLLGGELRGRRRRRRDVLVLRVLRLGLVRTTPDREEAGSDDRYSSERRDPPREPLTHGSSMHSNW